MQTMEAGMMPSFEIVPMFKFNPRLVYRVYMIPATMIMILALVCGFLPVLNIVGEKESGTMEQMNLTPVTKIHFILAKLIPYWVVSIVVLTISFFVAWLFYGLLPVGHFLTLYLFTLVFVFAISGFGLVISNYAKSIQQAIFTIFFFCGALYLHERPVHTGGRHARLGAGSERDQSPEVYNNGFRAGLSQGEQSL